MIFRILALCFLAVCFVMPNHVSADEDGDGANGSTGTELGTYALMGDPDRDGRKFRDSDVHLFAIIIEFNASVDAAESIRDDGHHGATAGKIFIIEVDFNGDGVIDMLDIPPFAEAYHCYWMR